MPPKTITGYTTKYFNPSFSGFVEQLHLNTVIYRLRRPAEMVYGKENVVKVKVTVEVIK